MSIKMPHSETAGIKSSLLKSMIAAALFLPLLFASCTSSVELHANADGSINILYDAAFDSAFIEIMQSLSGESGPQLFDADEIASQFRTAGIKDVRVASPANTSLGIALRLPKKEMIPYRGRAVFPDPPALRRSRFLPQPVQNYTNSCPIRCSRISIYLWHPFFSEKPSPKTNTSI